MLTLSFVLLLLLLLFEEQSVLFGAIWCGDGDGGGGGVGVTLPLLVRDEGELMIIKRFTLGDVDGEVVIWCC